MECTTSQQWRRRKNLQSLVSLSSGWKPCLLLLWWGLLDIKEFGSNVCKTVIIYKRKMLPLNVRLVAYLDPLRRTTLVTQPLTYHWDWKDWAQDDWKCGICGYHCVNLIPTHTIWSSHKQTVLSRLRMNMIAEQITIRLPGHLGPFRTLLL